MLATFLPQLAEELDMDVLEPTMPGVYLLPLDKDINITIATLPSGYTLNAQVTLCPENNKEGFYLRALQANLFGQGTRGAVLALNENGNVLTLSKVVEYNSDYREFKETLEDFVSTIAFWRDEARTHK